MKAVIQRVSEASITINGIAGGGIKTGLVVLLGIENKDTPEDIVWLKNKILNLRIFSDEEGLMNNSLLDILGEMLLVSQFTLHASTKKGNRPSFMKAAKPAVAVTLYEAFVSAIKEDLKEKLHTGEFGADMQISLVNNGPVTICIDTRNKE